MSEKKLAAVEAEIAAERAAALGRSEQRLRSAVAALNAFDAGTANTPTRAQLLDDASEACLAYVVQREAMGIGARDLRAVRAELRIPDEVWNRMGSMKPRS